jgi:hypothetical protein
MNRIPFSVCHTISQTGRIQSTTLRTNETPLKVATRRGYENDEASFYCRWDQPHRMWAVIEESVAVAVRPRVDCRDRGHRRAYDTWDHWSNSIRTMIRPNSPLIMGPKHQDSGWSTKNQDFASWCLSETCKLNWRPEVCVEVKRKGEGISRPYIPEPRPWPRQ